MTQKQSLIFTLIVLFIALTSGVTYAFYLISAANSDIKGEASCFVIKYASGQAITGDLDLGTNYDTGKSTDIVMFVGDECDVKAVGTLTLHTIKDQTDMDLTDGALKYSVVVGNQVLSTGAITGDEEQIIYNGVLNNSSTTYRVYVWLDSTLENNNIFVDESYAGYISASAKVASTITS